MIRRLPLQRSRRGFTLIELLVVMSIMIVLATIALLVVPDAPDRSRAAEGAERIQEWLLTAKQRAMRDRAPRGLRLLTEVVPNPQNPALSWEIARQFEIIEVPDNFFPQGVLNVRQARVNPNLTFPEHEILLTGAGDIRPFVKAGDFLELIDTEGVYRIVPRLTDDTSTPLDESTQLEFGAGVPGPAGSTRFYVTPEVEEARLAPFVAFEGGFRFIRRPKPLMGEDTLQLPTDVAVRVREQVLDAMGNPSWRPVSIGLRADRDEYGVSYYDVTFSPGGPITPAQQGRIALWVEDLQGTGEQTLMTVYSRTGAIASHPVATGPDPYEFTRDGRSSGL